MRRGLLVRGGIDRSGSRPAVVGVRGHLVAVEAHVGRGLPSLTITGLPCAGVQDARDRIRPAVESAGLEWPLRRVVVNLSPGTLRKEGPGLDLPVAMGVLAATAQVPAAALGGWAFAGELSLRGASSPPRACCRSRITAARAGLRGVPHTCRKRNSTDRYGLIPMWPLSRAFASNRLVIGACLNHPLKVETRVRTPLGLRL